MLHRSGNKNYNPLQIAYVIIDGLTQRRKYIQDCIRLGKLNVITDTGTVFRDCPVLNKDFSNIKFPDKVGETGTLVLISFIFSSSRPVVLGTIPNLDKYPYIQNENQQVEIAEDEDCAITIDKDPVNGTYAISIFGKTAGRSNFNISVGSVGGDAKCNIDVQGELKADVTKLAQLNVEEEFELNIRNDEEQEKFTNVKYKRGVGLEIVDEFDNKFSLKQQGSIIEIEKIRIGGKQGGETLKAILNDLIQAIQQMTLNTSQGPTFAPPINMAQFQSIISRISTFMEI